MFADEIRRAIEAANRITLPRVTAALWRAFGDGQVSEAEAEVLSGMIEARSLRGGQSERYRSGIPLPEGSISQGDAGGSSTAEASQDRRSGVRRLGVGSRPRTDASMERRRRWAASGRLPPGLAARFTLAEQAVLALVAAETARRKDCRLSIEGMAAVTGVCRSTVKNAVREARRLGLLTVEERQITGFRNDTNVLRIISPEWLAWIRLARRGDPGSNRRGQAAPQGGGVKSVTSTPTQVLTLRESGKTEPKESCRGAAGDLRRSARAGIHAGGGAGRAMR